MEPSSFAAQLLCCIPSCKHTRLEKHCNPAKFAADIDVKGRSWRITSDPEDSFLEFCQRSAAAEMTDFSRKGRPVGESTTSSMHRFSAMEMKTHKCFNIAHQREAEMRALYGNTRRWRPGPYVPPNAVIIIV